MDKESREREEGKGEEKMRVPRKILILTIFYIKIILILYVNLFAEFSTNEIEPEPGWGVRGSSIAWGDYDNDGDLDLAVAGEDGSGNRFRVYKNKGDGTFNTNEIEPEPGWGVISGSIAWGDYDNDGDLDLAVTGQVVFASKRLRVYKNKGDGTFDGYIEPEPGWGVSGGSIAWGDYDNDGDLDLAVAGCSSGWDCRIYKNKGDGTFDGYIEPKPGFGFLNTSIAWGDYDNDGDLDLAAAGFGTGGHRLVVIKNNGNGTFDSNEIEPEPGWGVGGSSIVWGDYDNDGDLDLAVAGQDAGSIKRFRVYKNNGNGTFNTNEIEPEPGWGVYDGSIAWGDYDNDGDLDLAVSGQAEGTTRRFRVYKNNGDGTFNTNEIEPEPGWGADMGSIACGDYDNDGDLDLAVTGLSSSGRVLRIYKNLESTTNNVPSTPTGMQSTNVSGFWKFIWVSPSDDYTPLKMLRYKIAISINQSGDYDYISDAIDYPRGQANIGNIPQGWISGTQCFYQSKISVTKKVYWKVGAIDTAFKFTWSGENIALPEEESLEKSEYTINSVVLIPNPFNPYKSKKDYITFFNCPDDIEIKIYNILGDKLVKLSSPNSEHQITWYGTDSKGSPLSRGVYIALLKDSQGNKRTIKFVIQR